MNKDMDITSLSCPHAVSKTIDQLQEAFRLHGITIYGRIDQQAEAAKAGLQLGSMELLLFGNPKAGIPLILKEPLCAVELPLKLLVWEDLDRKVWLSYTNFKFLQNRFGLPDGLISNLSKVGVLIEKTLSTQ